MPKQTENTIETLAEAAEELAKNLRALAGGRVAGAQQRLGEGRRAAGPVWHVAVLAGGDLVARPGGLEDGGGKRTDAGRAALLAVG